MIGTTLVFLEGILLGTYVRIMLGPSYFYTDGTKYDKVDGLLLAS